MSTPNFYYKNRCVVVTDDDMEEDNVPQTKWKACDRNYPQSIVVSDEYINDFGDLYLHDITLNAGYFTAACIDYQEKDEPREEVGHYFMAPWRYETAKEFIADAREMLPESLRPSRYRLRRIMGPRCGRDMEEYIDGCMDRLTDYIAEREREKCEKIVTYLRDKYGYSEYRCAWIASNGEAGYTKIH